MSSGSPTTHGSSGSARIQSSTDPIIVDTIAKICADHCPPEVVNAAEDGAWRIVNLRRERKRRQRQRARETADANAARHGRPGHETRLERAERAREQRIHDGHRLDDGDG